MFQPVPHSAYRARFRFFLWTSKNLASMIEQHWYCHWHKHQHHHQLHKKLREFSRIDCTSECYKLIIITCLIGYGELHDIKATNLLSLCSMGIDLCCIWTNHDWTIYALWLVQRIIGNWDLNNEFSSQLYTHSEALKREFRWNGLWWRQNEPNRTSKQNQSNYTYYHQPSNVWWT